MSQITLRITKGSALTQSEMDDNLRNLINSSSVDVTTGQLSLFTSESSGAEKQIDVSPKISEFIIKNVERSYEKMFKFIKDIDHLSLSTGKSININLIKKVLNK